MPVQKKINQIVSQNGIAILSHPAYLLKPYTKKQLKKINGFCGIEIYSPYKVLWSNPLMLWDYLLSIKHNNKIWGIASDDLHNLPKGSGKGWIMVKSDRLSQDTIVHSISKGSFYASCGIVINNIFMKEDKIFLELNETCLVKFISMGEVILKLITENVNYRIKGDEKYLRIEIIKPGTNKRAWLQPFFIRDKKNIYNPYSDSGNWYKGNIHTHTNIKGGNENVVKVIDWYSKANYDFLAITDHNHITTPL